MAWPGSSTVQRVSDWVVHSLEHRFYQHGRFVADHPLKIITASLSVVALCSLGLLGFYEEKDMVNLWIPEDIDFARNYHWLLDNYPPEIRVASMIFVDEQNVLRPEVVQQMYQVHKEVEKIVTSDGKTWMDLCMKLPILSLEQMLLGRQKRSSDINSFKSHFRFSDEAIDDPFETDLAELSSEPTSPNRLDPSVIFYPDPYCSVMDRIKHGCFETSLLEMFAFNGHYDEAFFRNLTQFEIVEKVNSDTISGAFMTETDFHKMLGGIVTNETGHVIKAKATMMQWFIKVNVSDSHSTTSNMGLDSRVDSRTLDFESRLIQILEHFDDRLPKGLKSYVNVQRSFADLSTKAIWGDVSFLVVGYVCVFTYVQLMLGRFSRVQQRAFLGCMAIASVALGVLSSFGVCSMMGLPYGPMHSIIPCLLIGLGVDNAFFLAQVFHVVTNNHKNDKVDLKERFAQSLRHAGVGITVTSVTDFVVFMIGGTTVLPSLRSYSMYSGLGIAFCYILQITFFTSIFYLDCKRIEQNRDGLLCCIVVQQNKSDCCSPKDDQPWLERVFHLYATLLMKPISKVFVLMLTVGMVIAGLYGNVNIAVSFDYVEFLPQNSSLYGWFKAKDALFPHLGEMGLIYITIDDFRSQLPQIRSLSTALASQPTFISHSDSWFPALENYFQDNFLPTNVSLDSLPNSVSDSWLHFRLAQFLFSPSGAPYKYQGMFHFENDTSVTCGLTAPNVTMTAMMYSHPAFEAQQNEHLMAMNWLKDTIRRLNFSGTAFAMSPAYSRWEIDEVIARELIRNLILGLVCVSLVTTVLIANLTLSIFVMISVILTLNNVVGFMYWWGLSIDIVAATNIIIAVGLCVDFSAHVAHSFMRHKGQLNDRARATLVQIGPAILHGGVSTLLSLVMLANSDSHVFKTYFKIFLEMVLFGLFHGLVFLPVVLSLLGPGPYRLQEKRGQEVDRTEDNQQSLMAAKVQPI